MSSPAPQSKNDQPQKPADTDRSAAETFLLPSAGEPQRQEQDVALAGELLKAGYLNDREIANVFGGWSVHGAVSLAEHLREQSELTEDQIATLQANAIAKASAVAAPQNLTGAGLTGEGVASEASASVSLVETLEKLDETGRVARLLGVSVAAGSAEHADRQSDARYKLVRKLGQGGLGRVWLARDESMQRLVALKEITNAGEANERTIARFRHEAEITGRLEHPGIVPVYQLGVDAETGFSFYTMRFLGKATLQDSISEYHERRDEGDEDPMLLRTLLTAFVNICHAIGHAHSRRVIHRDLKPENVVIDSFGQVIVIDWGLAKVLDEAAVEHLGSDTISGDGSGTVEGQVLGTPLYMAPEQAAGRLDEVDPRTDIYGLGAILFSIVTGHAPHERTQAEAIKGGAGARALISAIVSGPTPGAEDINHDVDPALAAICQKAMARKRYARYQTASELADEVQRWMADEPVSAYEEPPLQQARRWVRRHERLSQVLGALAAILVAAAVTMAVSARQNHVAQQRAAFEQMRGDAREVELHLRSAARDLAGDVRFMAGLPPIQGIIRARSGAEGEESEAVWRTRLESIFTGLLRSESDYLAIAYVASEANGEQTGGAKEIVRVERNVSEPTLIRSLPASRLRYFEQDPFLDEVLQLEPGDTRISVDPRPWQSPATAHVKRLTFAVPVYSDVSGEPFGMVAIETHLSGQIPNILKGLGVLAGEVYVVDGEGLVIAAAYPDGTIDSLPRGLLVASAAPEASALFSGEGDGELTDDATFYAKRFHIDPAGKGVGVVVRAPQTR